jgi:hypothetical protein
MNEETIKRELQKYNVTDAAIAKLNAEYMSLAVKDANDKQGYEVCKAARIDIKKRRVEVEKTRVILKAESLEYGRRVDGEAKRITALLEPIEIHLIGQEKIVDDEKARIKAEEEAKEAARVQARIDRLESMGMGLVAGHYRLPYGAEGVAVPVAILKVCTDEQFTQFVEKIQEKKDAEDARVKAEDDARKVESERLAKVSADQESERLRLAEITRRQAAEQATIDSEKKRIADAEREKQRLIDLEQARKEAAEKARIETEARIKREAEDKAAKEVAAKIAAEKKAARAPDKVKILLIADTLDAIQTPDVKTDDGKAVALSVMMSIAELIKIIRDKAEVL